MEVSDGYVVMKQTGAVLCHCLTREAAEYVVQCVNSHTELVVALQKIAAEADACLSEVSDINANGRMARSRFLRLTKMATNALNKARGGADGSTV